MVSTEKDELNGTSTGVRRNISDPRSPVSRKASVSTVASVDVPTRNRRAIMPPSSRSGATSNQAIERALSQKNQIIRARLPWLDGKAASSRPAAKTQPSMPGGFNESDSTPSSKSSDSQASPNLIKRKKSLTANAAIRPIGSEQALPRKPSTASRPRGAASLPSDDGRKSPSHLPGKPPGRLRDLTEAEHNTIALSSDKRALREIEPKPESVCSVDSPPTVMSYRQSIELSPRTQSPAASQEPLQKAITGLENLMQEAIHVAKDAADHGQGREVAQVLEDAAYALRRTSAISMLTTSKMASTLRASESGLDSSSLSPDDSSSSSSDSGTLIDRGLGPSSRAPGNPYDSSVGETPPQLYNPPSVDSISKDFAYDSGRRESRIDNGQHRMGQKPSAMPAVQQHPEPSPMQSQGSPTLKQRRYTIQTSDNPWVPARHNTGLHEDLEEGVRRAERSLTNGLDFARDPGNRPGERHPHEKRHYRGLDPNTKGLSIKHRKHFSLRSHHGHFDFGHHHRRQPIARKWGILRKRITAVIACINTGLVGYIVGVYAGEVPRIQYNVVDEKHYIIQGNIYLYIGLAISTFLFWPLPLLHGRKPYTLAALAFTLPLQFPQAVIVEGVRQPTDAGYRMGLLLVRFFTGLALGFANVNFITTILDLFGASLQSKRPHQELVLINDVRRQGGGMGLWLGLWTWSFIASIAIGFMTGAGIIQSLNPAWGFYVVVIIVASVLVLNVMAPEPRRSAYRRSMTNHYDDEKEKYTRRIARGEIKLHTSSEGPMWWGEEVYAGVKLSMRMFFQRGFMVLAFYVGWIYAQIVLVIILLGALLSRNYKWQPKYVGAGVMSIAIGALLAVPLSKANLFSRDRKQGPRTDSMTFQEHMTWSSHLLRRIVFMLVLPFAGLAYTLASPGRKVHYTVPIIFAGLLGFLSNLAIAECYGLIMETFDTSDLQPGANSRHRLQSLAPEVSRRRTNYSSFPRVTAGIFLSQTIAFLLAAAATGIGGAMTRNLGAQKATGVTAGILLFLTLLLTAALARFKSVQVIPNGAFGSRKTSAAAGPFAHVEDEYWKPVIIGNPSGKMRRMSLLELGGMSRWTEIRRLNNLLRETNGSSGNRSPDS